MAANDILLGEGVITIDGTAVGLTRGGSQFVVEREYRIIEADGDYGPVKGRIRKIRSVPKLTINALELSKGNMVNFFPATGLSGSDLSLYSSRVDVEDNDYHTVVFTGKTMDGRPVVLTLLYAINLENIDLSMTDKEEVVASITFTSTYLESNRTVENWYIDFP